ncbi:4128_t:CDS:2, partial [Racocetra persica]
YKFYIYLNESPFEPAHVHVLTSDMSGEMKPANIESSIPLINAIERPQSTILQIECNKETITAHLSDGRVLREAKLDQLKNVRIMPAKRGIYWPDLEEFLSIKAFTHGLQAGC